MNRRPADANRRGSKDQPRPNKPLTPSASFIVAVANQRYQHALALERAGRIDDALVKISQAQALMPGEAPCHYNKGRFFVAHGKLTAALDCYDKALALQPKHAESHLNRGNVLLRQERLDLALAAYDAALAIAPDHVGARANRSTALKNLGRLSESIAEGEMVLRLHPDHVVAHSNLLVTKPFMSQYNAESITAAHREFGLRHEPPFIRMQQPHANLPNPHRRLKIAYLSPQFNSDVMAPSILPLVEHHRRDQVSVHVFAHVPHADNVTERFRRFADEWMFIHGLSDDETAQRVRDSGIDILIHPMGHWAANRLLVLARKPAPIQVSYLCNSPTTGLTSVDYNIVDRWLDFDGRLGSLMTEKPVHLAHGFQIQSYDSAPPIHPSPSFKSGHITFGCFNNPSKLSPAALDLWSQALRAVPSSRLLLKGRGLDRPAVAGLLIDHLRSAGIAADRIELRGRIPDFDQHLESYRDVDIVLDTTPFTGGRTTMDALWMGVPVVTLVGDAVYGRFSYSHLMRLGAPELCAFSPDDFARIAAALAAAPDRLADYRQNLRPQLRASSLMDVKSHVIELEDAFRGMWRRWCAER
ncbi:MAG: tetratricopeptide repeat protein [Alphaproteobacteria bacterium]|nr:tetratricopeptide repeat protein [Alphaproteobacteria bacterium]